MHIFLSWSGQQSSQIASEFKDFLLQILPNLEVYLSTQEIAAGERWIDSIGKNLEVCSYGLLFLTSSNKESPWILFEAGALSKNFDASRVVPILCGIGDTDLVGSPLSQFQNKKLGKEEIWQLVLGINDSDPKPIDRDRLKRSFDAFWNDTSSKLDTIMLSKDSSTKSIPKTDISNQVFSLQESMAEVLKLLRSRPFDTPATQVTMVEAPRRPPMGGVRRLRLTGEKGDYFLLIRSGQDMRLRQDSDTPETLGHISGKLTLSMAKEIAAQMIADFESQGDPE